MQNLEKQIWDLIEPAIEDQDLRLVRVRYSGDGAQSTLQIMIEPQSCSKDNPESVNVDQCGDVSREVSAIMDVEDPISNEYNLEVSSTGMERPLVTARDFAEYAGSTVRLELSESVNERKRYQGELKGFEDDQILMDVDCGLVKLPLVLLKQAKLYFSPEQIKQIMNQKV